jgi:hypothetical protein
MQRDRVVVIVYIYVLCKILHFYNFMLVIDTIVQNYEEISLHSKPMRLIFMNYSV